MAIVDFDAALKKHPKYEHNMQVMDEYKSTLDSNVKESSKAFQTKLTEYQNKYFKLSDDEKKTYETQLASLEKAMKDQQKDYQQKMDSYEKEYMNPLQEDVKNAINLVADRHGYNFVTGADLFFVADASRDITQEVIDLLKEY